MQKTWTQHPTLKIAEIRAKKEAVESGEIISPLGHAILSAGENAQDMGLEWGSKAWRSEVLGQVNSWEGNERNW